MRSSFGLRWFFLIFFLTGAAGWILTGLVVYARLTYISLLMILFAGFWAVFSMRSMKLRRSARVLRASVGDIFEERFEVGNTGWPGTPWLEVLNETDMPMAAGSRLLTAIGARQKRFYIARTLLTRRGAFLLGPTTLTSGDPFGIFSLKKSVPASDTLVILPMTFPIIDFPPPPGILPGGKAIRQPSSDMTPHAAGVREYVPGDPMKRIHWPSTARRGRFMVKEFEQDPQADVWIFLDAFKQGHVSDPEPLEFLPEEGLWLKRPKVTLPRDTFEYAVSAAASLASSFLSERRAVGLVCSTGKLTVLSAERGIRQVNKIMETLAFSRPQGEMSILELVSMRAKLLPIGSGVILITPSVHPELILAVEDIQRRNLRPVVVLLKTETFAGAGDDSKVKSIAAALLSMNVPICELGYGDNLSTQLALPLVYFQRPYRPGSYSSARSMQ
jgi:uncharacterized protein (DUF58 family)